MQTKEYHHDIGWVHFIFHSDENQWRGSRITSIIIEMNNMSMHKNWKYILITKMHSVEMLCKSDSYCWVEVYNLNWKLLLWSED